MENICFHRRKLKFCTEETSVFPYRNFCFPRKLLFPSEETICFATRTRTIPGKNISRMIAINYRNILNLVTFA